MTPARKIVTSSFLLLGIGAIFIFSSTSPFYGDLRLEKHICFCMMSATIILAGFLYNIQKTPKILFIIYSIICALLLLITLSTSLGTVVNNSKRWISLGNLTFQPIELAKPGLIFILAAYLAGKNKKNYLYPALIIGTITLTILQPDVGQAIIISVTIIITFIIQKGLNKKVALLAGSSLAILVAGAYFTFSHVHNRINNYFEYLASPLEGQYQIKQSVVAISSGAMTGKGIGNSIQKLSYLPEASTDFSAAIIMEETGIIGLFAILALIYIFSINCLRVYEACGDNFFKCIILGFVVLYLLQSYINLMVNMALLPAKGVNLPFIGYGGSSMIMFSLMTSMVVSVASHPRRNTATGSAPPSGHPWLFLLHPIHEPKMGRM